MNYQFGVCVVMADKIGTPKGPIHGSRPIDEIAQVEVLMDWRQEGTSARECLYLTKNAATRLHAALGAILAEAK